MKRILFVASEAVPFVKTGGLADVTGSLPAELTKNGLDIRIILPKYGDIAGHYKDRMEKVAQTTVHKELFIHGKEKWNKCYGGYRNGGKRAAICP